MSKRRLRQNELRQRRHRREQALKARKREAIAKAKK